MKQIIKTMLFVSAISLFGCNGSSNSKDNGSNIRQSNENSGTTCDKDVKCPDSLYLIKPYQKPAPDEAGDYKVSYVAEDKYRKEAYFSSVKNLELKSGFSYKVMAHKDGNSLVIDKVLDLFFDPNPFTMDIPLTNLKIEKKNNSSYLLFDALEFKVSETDLTARLVDLIGQSQSMTPFEAENNKEIVNFSFEFDISTDAEKVNHIELINFENN